MEIQIDGKPLSEAAPDAVKYFATEDTLRVLAVEALIKGVAHLYETRIKTLERELKVAVQDGNDYLEDNIRLTEELGELRAKISHRKKPVKELRERRPLQKIEVRDEDDETTEELMKEAYPSSKSEMRRHAVMKKSEVNRGK